MTKRGLRQSLWTRQQPSAPSQRLPLPLVQVPMVTTAELKATLTEQTQASLPPQLGHLQTQLVPTSR